MAFESLATPVAGHKAWSRDAASGDSLLSEDSARSERYALQADGWWSLPSGIAVGEVAADSGPLGRWAGMNDLPVGPDGHVGLPAQFDSAFSQTALYPELLRRRAGQPAGTSELGLGGVVDSALRNAWDSVADDNNSANISLAGFELSLTLRGDQRSLLINGYDILQAIKSGAQGQESWQGQTPVAVQQGDGAQAAALDPVPIFGSTTAEGGGNLVSDVLIAFQVVRGVVSHPLTIFFVLTYLAAWLSVRVMQAMRERRRSYRHYRR